ncbi:MAG: type II toxin-antitoxin system Phd/YefM family antitoxin [Lacipirellulaceae bacterium]
MEVVDICVAQVGLRDLIAGLSAGASVTIVDRDRPVAVLSSLPAPLATPRFGACKGMLVVNTEDDEHLADFAEYVP